MPRFFSDLGNSSDSLWFMVAIIGELIGLGTTVYGGARSGGTFLIFATLAIIMFIFCDFFFAVKLHRNKGNQCKIDSLEMLNDADDTDAVAKLDGLNLAKKKGKFADLLYQTGIILIAIIKVIGIVLLGVFNNLILYVPFAVVYLIVAYVHLNHTGYYFAYLATENAIKKDHRAFADGGLKNKKSGLEVKEKRQTTSTSTPLKMPIQYTPHKIVPDGENNLTYIIHAKGVLTDDDIMGLVDGQSNENAIALFKACRRLQLTY